MAKRVSNEDFIKNLHIINPNIKPLERYVKAIEKIRFQCLIDGTIFESTPNNVLRGHGCPMCGRIKGVQNSLRTKRINNSDTLLNSKHPHLTAYLKNKDDAFKYGYTSRHKITWICPDCHFEFQKSPSTMFNGNFVCPNCIKNDSYPNRFMFNILTQLGVEFEREYSPDWIKPKRYDFYIPKERLIIEMDGSLHNKYDVKKNDNYKNEMAINHNLRIIRINCDYSKTEERFSIVSKNVKDSFLFEVYNPKLINWDEANAFALKNEVSYVCELWEKYNDLDKIQEKTKLTLYTIKKYLNFGRKNNMCSYDHDQCMEDRKIKRIKNGHHGRSVSVICNETKEYFPNMKEASEKYHCNIARYFYQNGTYAGILPNGTKLTWRKVNDKNEKEAC